MNITTKFSVGDKVFRIERHHEKAIIACTVCGDTKKVDIKGTLFQCPNCERGTARWRDRWFHHTQPTTIGQVSVVVALKTKHTSNYFNESAIQGDGTVAEERYMLSATGIGSGTLWEHNLLFLTLEEAQKQCDALNTAIIADEAALPA